MSEIGKMFVTVTANTKDLVDKINRDGDAAAKGFGAKFSSGFAAVGKAALAAGAIGATAAVAGAAFGVKTAAANQQAMISFTVLMGSAEKAQAQLQKLADFAAQTPFDLPTLRDAAARLQATGVDAERVIPIMRSLGDATAAMGTGAAGIDRAVTALQQMSNAGRVTGGDMNQLASAGIPAWNALAAAIGKSPAEVRQLVSDGKVQVDTLLSAIEKQTGSTFATVKGTMEKQSASLVGQFSTLKDTVTQQLGQASQPLADALQKSLPDVTKAVSGLVTGLQPAITAIGGLVQSLTPVLEPLGKALGSIGNALISGLAVGFKALAPVAATLAPALQQVGDALGKGLVQVFSALAPVLPRLAKATAQLVIALIPIIPLAAEILLAFLPLIDLVAGAAEVLTPIIAGIVNFIAQSGLLKGILVGITAVWLAFNIVVAANPIGLIVIAIVGLVGAIKMLWDNNETFRNAVVGIWNGIKTAVKAVADWFTNTLVPFFKNVWDLLLAGLNLYLTPYKAAWAVIQFAAKAVVSWFQGTLVPLFQNVWGLLGKAVDLYVTPYKIAWKAIQAVAQAVIGWFTGTLLPFFQGLWTRLGNGWNIIKTKVTEVWNNIITFLKGLVTRFTEIGTMLVEGIKNGIANGWTMLTDFAKQKAQDLIDGVKGVFGIHSPSRVMIEMGGNVVEGFRLGLEPIGKVNEEFLNKMDVAVRASDAKIKGWVDSTKKNLDEAVKAWEDYRSSVLTSITGNVNFADAANQTEEQKKAVQEAQKALTDAQAAAAAPNATESDKTAVTTAQQKLIEAQVAVKTFEQNLSTMLDQSDFFGQAYQKASDAMLAQFGANSPIWQMMSQQMLAAGPVQGANLATQIATNGLSPEMQTRLLAWNAWAGSVATDQANKNKGQGVQMAVNAMAGLKQKIKDERERLVGLGESMGDGVVVGFKNKESAFKSAIDSYIRTARQTLDINSPSKVFRSIGDSVGEGFNEGVQRSTEPFSPPLPSTPDAVRLYAPGMSMALGGGTPAATTNVQVFLGDKELTDLVDVQIQQSNDQARDLVIAGRRY